MRFWFLEINWILQNLCRRVKEIAHLELLVDRLQVEVNKFMGIVDKEGVFSEKI